MPLANLFVGLSQPFPASALPRPGLQRLAARATDDQWAELRQRMADVEDRDLEEAALYAKDSASLPVVCLDALMPRQCLDFTTEDPTFSRFLRHIGLGGLFGIVGLNFRQKRLRRDGVIARVGLVDASCASPETQEHTPTAVRACLIGRRRIRVSGPAVGMTQRVGRWRQGYCSDELIGGGPALGWGEESFVDAPKSSSSSRDACGSEIDSALELPTCPEIWSDTSVEILMEQDEVFLFQQNTGVESPIDVPTSPSDVIEDAETLRSLLDDWQRLARDLRTYENVDVVAGRRARHGFPGLTVDPAGLLDNVLDDLGPQPPALYPTALALWAAALVNPLPSMGVALEMRGAVLEARDARERLAIVLRGVRRSIANLEGRQPL